MGAGKNIVSFSGGKDSTAMLLMMIERGVPVDEVRFFDTGWEFPEMHDHILQVEVYTGIPITTIKPKDSFDFEMLERPVVRSKGINKGEVHRYGYGWPSFMRRWCTTIKNRYLNVGVKADDAVFIGFALDEIHRAEKLQKKKKNARFPLVEYGVSEIEALKYCTDRGFTWGGLYEHHKRVSCFCCPLQNIKALRALRKHHPHLWKKMLDWELEMGVEKRFKGKSVLDFDRRFGAEGLEVSE